MKFWLYPAILTLVTAASVAAVSAQTTLDWAGLSGVDNELTFAIPEGYQVSEDGEAYIGSSEPGVRINNRRVVTKYVNGAVLMMEYGEGKTKQIEPVFSEIRKLALVGEREFGGFRLKAYKSEWGEIVREEQRFFTKDRLYVLSAVYRGKRSEFIDVFFKSVRLLADGKEVAPNLARDATKSEINREFFPVKVDPVGSNEVEENPDSPALIVYLPRPSYRREFGKSNSGAVKLKLLCLPSGRIGKVELLSAPNVSLFEGVRASAEHIVFLPALKGGRAVASWKAFDYRFQMQLISF